MRIGELAAKAGVTQKAVRYYESRGVLRSRRNPSGYRDFDDRALEIVRAIRAGQHMGLRLEDLREVLEHVGSGIKPCADLRSLIAKQRAEVAERILELQLFDAYLAEIESSPAADDSGVCPILGRAETGHEVCPRRPSRRSESNTVR
ncbi:MAG: hypothetical protein NVS4B13_01720 [Candidatus Elarobacter sp.]